MKLYLLYRKKAVGYDQHDSIIVCAENEEDALTIDPYGNKFIENKPYNTWAKTTKGLICEEIGEANEKQTRGVIIASFNAG